MYLNLESLERREAPGQALPAVTFAAWWDESPPTQFAVLQQGIADAVSAVASAAKYAATLGPIGIDTRDASAVESVGLLLSPPASLIKPVESSPLPGASPLPADFHLIAPTPLATDEAFADSNVLDWLIQYHS